MERRNSTAESGETALPRLFILLALAAVGSVLLFFLSAFLVVDGDLFHEMALARETIAQGQVRSEDVFAFTPTVSPSVHHEWGTGMVLYGVVTRAGARGLLALKYFLGLAVLALEQRAKLVAVLRDMAVVSHATRASPGGSTSPRVR